MVNLGSQFINQNSLEKFFLHEERQHNNFESEELAKIAKQDSNKRKSNLQVQSMAKKGLEIHPFWGEQQDAFHSFFLDDFTSIFKGSGAFTLDWMIIKIRLKAIRNYIYS